MLEEHPHPALAMLMFSRWDDAFGWLHSRSGKELGETISQALLDNVRDGDSRTVIHAAVNSLYAIGEVPAGELALAWSMLTCSPARPASFRTVLPQLQYVLDKANLSPADDAEARERIRVWWRAAKGEFVKDRISIFSVTHAVLNDMYPEPAIETPAPPPEPTGPYVVVMPKCRASKLKSEHGAFKEMLDIKLPLVVATDVAGVRRTLLNEYPHATAAIDLIMRDLREGEPVRLKPLLLVGPPGNGKSRLIRRLGDLLGVGTYRFDGGSSSDGVGYGGTPRGWSESTPSAPARAVQAYRIANPICMVDELDKACANPRNGALFTVLLAHLERESASRFRDASLDAELDLGHVLHCATANSTEGLPAPLLDRYRIIKVPAPTLAHLPALAARVVDDLAREDESLMGQVVTPFAPDELAVMGRAWSQARFSMRALQKIVTATLEARDQHAMRH